MIVTQPPAIVKRMIDAALKAAHIALLRRKQGLNVKEKADGSKVTSGDYQAQQIIKAELEKLSPSLDLLLRTDRIGFIMEETIPHDVDISESKVNWVVDPVDGTIGYSRKLGEESSPWAISIALVKEGKTLAAVVYEAAAHEYGTSKRDFDDIDPCCPQGKIFWADVDERHAYCIEGKDSDISVVPMDPKENYAQRTVALDDGYKLPILTSIPALYVYVGHTKVIRLDAATKIKPYAKPLLDTPNNKEFAAKCGWKAGDYEVCLSAVSGAMRAADGRATAFIATKCREWDRAAAALILEKSRTPFSEYKRPEKKEAA